MDRINLESAAMGPSRRIRLPLIQKQIRTEMTEDFTLPDYQPEIRRLLRISATVQPPAGFIGAGEAEFTGTVDFTVFYTGNDGSLSAAPLSAEYRFRLPLDEGTDFDLSEAPEVFAVSEAEAVSGRVTAPRRLTVKCRIVSKARCDATCFIGERYTGETVPQGEQYRLTDTCDLGVVCSGIENSLTLTDEIIPDGPTDGLRVISADGKVFVSGAEAASGAVRCRGETIISLCVVREDAGENTTGSLLSGDTAGTEERVAVPDIRVLTRRLPFDAEIPVEGADVSGEATVFGTCSDLSVSVEEGRILMDAGLTLRALCQKKQQIEYTKDLYADSRSCVCGFTDRKIPFPIAAGNANLTAGGTAALSELGIRPESKPVEVSGEAHIDEILREKDKLVLAGSCRFRMLLMGADGELSAGEAEFPFRFTPDGIRLPEDGELSPDGDVSAELLSCRVRIDGERLAADGEVSVSYRIMGERTVRMPETVRFGERRAAAGKDVHIYFPASGETLWDAAKRFAVPVQTLAEKNDLPAAVRADDRTSLGKNKFLLI